MQGKIIKGIAGFYYVQTEESGLYECKAKGIFRKEKIKPLVGDNVELSITDEAKKTGNVDEILPRKNTLIRPSGSGYFCCSQSKAKPESAGSFPGIYGQTGGTGSDLL